MSKQTLQEYMQAVAANKGNVSVTSNASNGNAGSSGNSGGVATATSGSNSGNSKMSFKDYLTRVSEVKGNASVYGGTTASGNTTQPSANMTPTQIKAWEKNPTKQKQVSSYVSRVGSADSSAYAQAAKDRTEKQRRTLTPTTIRAIDNSYSDSTKQYYYGKSKYTTDSTDADQQAYVRGINMWGDTGTWYEQAGQTNCHGC